MAVKDAARTGRVEAVFQGNLGGASRSSRAWARCLVALALLCATVMISRHAEAGKTTGGSPTWELPRSPFVPHRATPSALECEMDEDDDGLDDEIEGLLAERFVPVIRFASGEAHVKSGAQFPGGKEPFVAFNVWPRKVDGDLRINIVFATLYTRDGGYYSHFPGGQGTNSHPGDS